MNYCATHAALDWIEDGSGGKHCRNCGIPYRKWEPLKWMSPEEAARFVRRERITWSAALAIALGAVTGLFWLALP